MQKHIMERKRNINSIIHDQLLGQLSEEEEKRLQVWIESSLENKKNYESLMKDTVNLQQWTRNRPGKSFRKNIFKFVGSIAGCFGDMLLSL